MRKKIFLSATFLIAGIIFFVISSSGKGAHTHYQLDEFYEKLEKNPAYLSDKYMTLYGDVKEGSIEKSGLKAHFILQKGSKELPVFFNGKTLLPDTFKDGSQAGAEGIYDMEKGVFISHKVMAKCASRYDSYPQ